MRWLRKNLVNTSARRLSDSESKADLLDGVVPIVGYDMATGELVNIVGTDTDAYHKSETGEISGTTSATPTTGDKFLFEDATDSWIKKSCDFSTLGVDTTQNYTWTGKHTFQGHMSLQATDKLYFGDEDSYITESDDDVIGVYTAGVLRWDWNVGTSIRCYRALRFEFGGSIVMGDPGNNINMGGNEIANIDYARFDEVSKPTPSANHGDVYCKDVGGVAEVFAQDDAGNETQQTSHDLDGFYLHRSIIPKRGIMLEIFIEKFFREHYPEYIKETKL